MNIQQVFQRFTELVHLSEEQAENYKWLCCNAVEELEEMLVKDVDISRCSGRLSAAASAMAFYKYIIIEENSNVNSFKAGDITVNYSDRGEFAKNYLQQCMKSIAPYIKDSNFVFRGVKANDIPDNL
ncbi:MAG: hypothetical protein UIM53_04075 [Acutalibacteraceae bacterium]|nr:hypothetical protein [Acutalibacteraceae bacterium]